METPSGSLGTSPSEAQKNNVVFLGDYVSNEKVLKEGALSKSAKKIIVIDWSTDEPLKGGEEREDNVIQRKTGGIVLKFPEKVQKVINWRASVKKL